MAGGQSEGMECTYCGRPTDLVECDRCETVVCPMCLDSELGFCAACAQRAKPTGRRGDTFLL